MPRPVQPILDVLARLVRARRQDRSAPSTRSPRRILSGPCSIGARSWSVSAARQVPSPAFRSPPVRSHVRGRGSPSRRPPRPGAAHRSAPRDRRPGLIPAARAKSVWRTNPSLRRRSLASRPSAWRSMRSSAAWGGRVDPPARSSWPDQASRSRSSGTSSGAMSRTRSIRTACRARPERDVGGGGLVGNEELWLRELLGGFQYVGDGELSPLDIRVKR